VELHDDGENGELTRAEVRRRLHEVLRDDSELDAFVLDHFDGVRRKFTNGMDRTAKISVLLATVSPREIMMGLHRHGPVQAVPSSKPDRDERHPSPAMPSGSRRSPIEVVGVAAFLCIGIGIYADMRSKITGLEEKVSGSEKALAERIGGTEKGLGEKINGTEKTLGDLSRRLDRLEDRFTRKFGAETDGTRDSLDGGPPDRVGARAVRSPAEDDERREFDQAAAREALARVAGAAANCKTAGDPDGIAKVAVTFVPSGRVTIATVQGSTFQGTPTGSCIASVFRGAKVPSFNGAPVMVTKDIYVH
jgi:hypothetical protein